MTVNAFSLSSPPVFAAALHKAAKEGGSVLSHLPEHLKREYGWAVLDAYGIKGRSGAEIDDLPQGPLSLLQEGSESLHAAYEASFIKKKATQHNVEPALLLERNAMRLQNAQQKAHGLSSFLEAGGHILGGKNRGRLALLPSPPCCVYGFGDSTVYQNAQQGPSIAIVGTRKASERALARVYRWAEQLAQAGAVVVSGGAVGIDYAAHAGALDGGGQTLAVLGDKIATGQGASSQGANALCGRPLRLQHLFEKHAPSQGYSFSEYGPWHKVHSSHFVTRNRLVAAMADAVIVVEGKARSGALHTAHAARKLNIPVYALPGDVDDVLAQAPNQLLAAGHAQILLSIEVILKKYVQTNLKTRQTNNVLKGPFVNENESRYRAEKHSNGTQEKVAKEPKKKMMTRRTLSADCVGGQDFLTGIEKLGGRVLLDDLAEKLGLPISELLEQALLLEIEGVLRREGAYLCLL